MWKKTLTIDKKYDKELRALLRELGKNKSLVFTVEEDRSRKVVSVASTGADSNAANDYLCDRVARLLTTYFKHAFISDRLNKKEFEEYMKFLNVICENESMTGLSIHMLDIFRKD